ncbi:MAG: hypothetical protein PHI27_08020 [Eubacteriales bacterium]|nr:hypothetical protein [Eubacteriales bacterium]MDD3882184.1 hypothetical protein [Eubacteriales bacterium]MDD4513772.1 hypothetical protein [Eubacteriales bacterium]
MKKVLTGGFLSLVGILWTFAVISSVSSNLVSGWSTPPGRFITTASEIGMMLPLVISVLITLFGVAIMFIGCFKKDA